MRRPLVLAAAALAAALTPAGAAVAVMTAARDTAPGRLSVDRLERHLKVAVTDPSMASAPAGEPRALAVTLPGPVAAGATVALGFRLRTSTRPPRRSRSRRRRRPRRSRPSGSRARSPTRRRWPPAPRPPRTPPCG